jgi:5,10-methylenetetrahydrofolate reductase
VAAQADEVWRAPAFYELLSKQFVIAVELDPPRGTDDREMMALAELALHAGVDAFNISDSPKAQLRMNAVVAAWRVQGQFHVPAVCHLTARERGALALGSELLGAWQLGVRNLLALTGDSSGEPFGPPRLTSVELVRLVSALNAGYDPDGNRLEGLRPQLDAGVAFNPYRQPLADEVQRLSQKWAAGARWAMWQPVFEAEPFDRAWRAIPQDTAMAHVVGLVPLGSVEHAQYLMHELPGVTISKDLLKRLPATGMHLDAGFLAMQAMLAEVVPRVQGVYLWVDKKTRTIVPEMVALLRQLTA